MEQAGKEGESQAFQSRQGVREGSGKRQEGNARALGEDKESH